MNRRLRLGPPKQVLPHTSDRRIRQLAGRRPYSHAVIAEGGPRNRAWTGLVLTPPGWDQPAGAYIGRLVSPIMPLQEAEQHRDRDRAQHEVRKWRGARQRRASRTSGSFPAAFRPASYSLVSTCCSISVAFLRYGLSLAACR
jgi:hypothetical protein